MSPARRADDEPPAGYAVTIGETMALLRQLEAGPLQHATTLGLGIGGAESNVAIGLQRLGVPAAWVGRLGADSLGELVIRQIRGEGVLVKAVRDPDAPTGLMVKEHRSALDTRVWYYRAGLAGARLSPADIDLDLVREARLLHVTGITLALSATAAGAVFDAVRVARKAGVPVSFDLNNRSALWSRTAAQEAYRAMMPLADIVFAGDDEAEIALGPTTAATRAGTPGGRQDAAPQALQGAGHAAAAGDTDPFANGLRLARGLIALGAGEAVIKLGARGAAAVVAGAEYRQQAVPVPVVDTVGAGDAFVAGYLAELLAGAPVATRLHTAATAGAYVCTVAGDWEGLPRRDELATLGSGDPVSR
ncbi:MAG TPA: sugar kinase [Microbacteriaceae bacterium]|nr:sugar kinase [Microbacteriaceae bacterium]